MPTTHRGRGVRFGDWEWDTETHPMKPLTSGLLGVLSVLSPGISFANFIALFSPGEGSHINKVKEQRHHFN